ncbi:hypothetical protein MRX96_023371 [Rhipicephalus microplus]
MRQYGTHNADNVEEMTRDLSFVSHAFISSHFHGQLRLRHNLVSRESVNAIKEAQPVPRGLPRPSPRPLDVRASSFLCTADGSGFICVERPGHDAKFPRERKERESLKASQKIKQLSQKTMKEKAEE